MNHPPIISILGNSVPLLIQPFRTNASEMTYAEHLRNHGFIVVNAAKQSVILSDVYHYFEDECIRHFPDYVIINFGIVDCTYRARPRWLQNIFSMNAWNNSIIRKGYNGPITRGIKFIGKKTYRRTIERFAYTLKIKNRWLAPRDFKFILRDIIKRLFQDTPAKKIVLLGMTPVADWVEREVPGTQESIREYNGILKDVGGEYGNLTYIDPATLGSDIVSPDGIHFTARGHEKIATTIIPLLAGDRSDYTGWQDINQYEGLYKVYENWNKRKTPGPK